MKELLRKIIDKLFCCHEWQQWKNLEVEDDFGSTYAIYHFYCTKCGKFKKVKSY